MNHREAKRLVTAFAGRLLHHLAETEHSNNGAVYGRADQARITKAMHELADELANRYDRPPRTEAVVMDPNQIPLFEEDARGGDQR